MSTGILETAASIFGATGGVGTFGALLGYRVARRQATATTTATEASAASTFTKTALELLEPVRRAAAESESRANAFLQQIAELEAIVASLTNSLTQATAQATAERDRAERQLAQEKADCAAETARLRELLAARDKELSALQNRGVA